MENKDLKELNALQKVEHELQQYYTLLRLMRADFEKMINNFRSLNEE